MWRSRPSLRGPVVCRRIRCLRRSGQRRLRRRAAWASELADPSLGLCRRVAGESAKTRIGPGCGPTFPGSRLRRPASRHFARRRTLASRLGRLHFSAARSRSLTSRGRTMSRLRVESFTLSLDGFGAGPDQDIDNPLGVGGTSLHGWALSTRTFQKHLFGNDGGGTGIDDDFAARGFENIGAWILGRNMFGPVRGPWRGGRWCLPDARWFRRPSAGRRRTGARRR